MNYKELKLKGEKLNSEVENQGNYKVQRTWKIDKSEINMEVLNKIIAFKMLEIMRDHELIDEREYAKIEKKRTQFGVFRLEPLNHMDYVPENYLYEANEENLSIYVLDGIKYLTNTKCLTIT